MLCRSRADGIALPGRLSDTLFRLMFGDRFHRWQGLRLLLGAIFLVVQVWALTHALTHDLGAPQDQVCLSCLAAQPTGSAPINSSWLAPVDIALASRFEIPAVPSRSISVPFARQRAPPLTG